MVHLLSGSQNLNQSWAKFVPMKSVGARGVVSSSKGRTEAWTVFGLSTPCQSYLLPTAPHFLFNCKM